MKKSASSLTQVTLIIQIDTALLLALLDKHTKQNKLKINKLKKQRLTQSRNNFQLDQSSN